MALTDVKAMKYGVLHGTVSPGLVALDGLKHDTNYLTETFRGFHVGVGGNIKFNDTEDNAITIAVNSGAYYPYAISKIWSTGTTATGIFGVR